MRKNSTNEIEQLFPFREKRYERDNVQERPSRLITNWKETMTSRDKKLHEVGDVTNLMANKDYSKTSGKYIRITKIYQKALGAFTDLNIQPLLD